MLSQQAPYSGAESANSYARIYVQYKKGRVTVFTFVLRVCSRHKCQFASHCHRVFCSETRDASPLLSIRIAPVV